MNEAERRVVEAMRNNFGEGEPMTLFGYPLREMSRETLLEVAQTFAGLWKQESESRSMIGLPWLPGKRQ